MTDHKLPNPHITHERMQAGHRARADAKNFADTYLARDIDLCNRINDWLGDTPKTANAPMMTISITDSAEPSGQFWP